jgi:hypothetical protein
MDTVSGLFGGVFLLEKYYIQYESQIKHAFFLKAIVWALDIN